MQAATSNAITFPCSRDGVVTTIPAAIAPAITFTLLRPE